MSDTTQREALINGMFSPLLRMGVKAEIAAQREVLPPEMNSAKVASEPAGSTLDEVRAAALEVPAASDNPQLLIAPT